MGRLRRDTSLVNQASQITGRAIRKGEAAWKKRGAAGRRRSACGPTVEEAARPARPGRDGYVRRSPVQPYRCPKVRRWKSLLLRWGLLFALGLALGLLFWRSGLLRMF